jgi:methionyl-tRNA synthetase
MFCLCAADEHGVAISMKAKKEGITPQEVIDKYDGIIVNRLLTLISPLIIILELQLKFTMIQLQSFTTLYEKGDFIEQVTEQLYDAKADQFLADRFVIGLAQNVAMKKLMATNVKMWFNLECYRFNQPKINHNWRNPCNEINETLVLPLDRYEIS